MHVVVFFNAQEMVDWFNGIRAARYHYLQVAYPGAHDTDVSISLSLSLSHTHTHTDTLRHTHTHTHTHTQRETCKLVFHLNRQEGPEAKALLGIGKCPTQTRDTHTTPQNHSA